MFCPNQQNKETAIEKVVSLVTNLLESNLLFSLSFEYEDSNKDAIDKIISELGIITLSHDDIPQSNKI